MTELSAEKLAELREITGSATPGPWVFSPDDGSALDADVVFALDDAGEEVSTVTAWIDANDAEHIAAFDPPTVIQLIDRIAELESRVIDLLGKVESQDAYIEDLEWLGRSRAEEAEAKLAKVRELVGGEADE